MNPKEIKAVHCIGIGGINMSAVAKLLLAAGVRVSGSDIAANEQTEMLIQHGAQIVIGHKPENIPPNVDVVVYTSATQEDNPERVAAATRSIPSMTNFTFLGQWFKHHKTIAVVGTHGKSTTTAALGLIAEHAKLDPTVIVGTKVPAFPDGNLRVGKSDLFIVEGDEYARHFLEFQPYGVLLNNIELDHTDVFPTMDALLDTFRELLAKIRYEGILVANIGDPMVRKLVTQEKASLEALHLRVVLFNGEGGWSVSHACESEASQLTLKNGDITHQFTLKTCGAYNALNSAGAALMALELGATAEDAAAALSTFGGVWRRFELLRDSGGIRIFSDYGHHPTAVRSVLEATKETYPNARIILCFQPHHRVRTKSLFLDFIPSFDLADELILCEIYDVAGREMSGDQNISSQDVLDAVVRHDADRGTKRFTTYEPTPERAVQSTLKRAKSGDIVIMMGAGDIDDAVRKAL